MALFRGIQEYFTLNVNNITLVFDSGNIFLYPPKKSHPIVYKYRRISIENALNMKLSHSKYNHCLFLIIKKKSIRIIKPKYNEHLSHRFQPAAT